MVHSNFNVTTSNTNTTGNLYWTTDPWYYNNGPVKYECQECGVVKNASQFPDNDKGICNMCCSWRIWEAFLADLRDKADKEIREGHTQRAKFIPTQEAKVKILRTQHRHKLHSKIYAKQRIRRPPWNTSISSWVKKAA